MLGRVTRRRAGRGDHRLQHLLAADRRAWRTPSASPARFLGVHWFNPPEWTPGHRGDRRPRDRAARPSTACSRSCARSASARPRSPTAPGFVSNRLQMALLREAIAIVDEGQTTREQPRRGRAHHVRLPPAVLRPVPDRRHGRARHQRERVRDARARRRPGVRGARPRCASRSTPAGSAPRAARASRAYSDDERDDAAARARSPLRRAREAAGRSTTAVDVCAGRRSRGPNWCRRDLQRSLGRSG